MSFDATVGGSSSNSYVAVAECTAFCVDRGYIGWAAASSTEQEQALVRATSWIDATYGGRFSGVKVGGRAQALVWPMNGAYDAEGIAIPNNEIPIEVRNATMEAAYIEIGAPGSLSLVFNMSRAAKREKVEGLEVEYFGETLKYEDFKVVVSTVEGYLRGIATLRKLPAAFVV